MLKELNSSKNSVKKRTSMINPELIYHRFMGYFESDHAQQLCQVAFVQKYPDKTIVFEEGEYSDFLYLVLAGSVEFSKFTSSNQYQKVAVAQPDDFFGECGILDGQPRSARAVTQGETQLAKIHRDHLLEVLKEAKGDVVLKLFGKITQNLRRTTTKYIKQLAYKEKMELVGEMVNSILHDFKSPFTGIQLSNSLLKEMHSDDESQELCDLISIQIQRMLGMAEEVLEFSQGCPKLCLKPLHLAELLAKFEKLNRVYLKSSQIKFELEITHDIIINADEQKLIRVLQNLVGNAVEALTPSGGCIQMLATVEQNWVKLTISDNGPGIPADIQDCLFEAFVTHGKPSGTGLGTAIAKSIIEGHGGKINFRSNSMEGTTFYIHLPLAETSMNRSECPNPVAVLSA